MKARDVMSKPVVCCRLDANLAEAASMMWGQNCGALPVVNNDGKLVGLITDRDICMALGTRNRRASEVRVNEICPCPAKSCGLDEEISTALQTMCHERVRRLPVVDKLGVPQGILSLNDLVLWAQHCDGAKRPGISFEDIVNTLVGICQRRRGRRVAA